MAALNFDDGEKKSRDILDLSQVSIRSESELQKWLEKVPDFKIRPEKVRSEDVKLGIEEGLSSRSASPAGSSPWKSTSSSSSSPTSYPFCDPVPPSMKDVSIKELGRVNINWRMLTVARPKTKLEEDIFSRLVQLEKLQYKTMVWENEQEAIRERRGHTGPCVGYRGLAARGMVRSGMAGRSGGSTATGATRTAVTETRNPTCKECGEEFCTGTCKKYLYDEHSRTLNPLSDDIFKISERVPRKSKKPSGAKRSTKPDETAASVVDADEEVHDPEERNRTQHSESVLRESADDRGVQLQQEPTCKDSMNFVSAAKSELPTTSVVPKPGGSKLHKSKTHHGKKTSKKSKKR